MTADSPHIIANRYQVQDVLGQGGMGTVFRGLDTQTDQPVAIKSIIQDLATPEMIERFIREGEALRQLNHPNIVQMLDTVQAADQHYLIMELVTGGALDSLLRAESPMRISRILEIALDLADALTRAHRLNIIHRDIKPANVLIADDGTPRLTDFGIAHTNQSTMTGSGMILGTYAYLAPEALMGEAITPRADIWAFGVMLFEMLTGQRPFVGENPGTTITAILSQPLPDLEPLRPDAPLALIDLIYRMLAKNPAERIPSVRRVGSELEDILQGRTSSTPSQPIVTKPLDNDMTFVKVGRFETSNPTLNMPKHHLPAQATPFIGRESELQALADLLANPDHRLITIIAPGGMGKTRLSLAAAERFIPTSEQHTVYFVELAQLSQADDIVPTLAEALKYQFQADGRSEQQQVLDFLSHKTALLVIDNWEHVLEGASLVTDILKAAPKIQIVATSRQRLGQAGEVLFNLSGMDFPDMTTPEDAMQYAAIKLFVNSALRAQPSFVLQQGNLEAVATICKLVQGMPLGIVLAAAWLTMLSPQEIAAEIQQGMDFLADEDGTVPERQRSIRAVFEYAWQQMSADEQQVFMQLSVFRGGFTREAAQQVAGASLRQLMNMVNKSLLIRDNLTGRYVIHELLRQYAEEQLGSKEAAYAAHATYFADLMQDRWAHLKDHRGKVASEEIVSDIENIRTAWRYWIKHQQAGQLRKFTDAIWLVFEARSWFQPAVNLLQEALVAHPSEEMAATRAHITAVQAWFKALLGQPHEGLPLAQASVETLQKLKRDHELFIPLTSININGIFLNQMDIVRQSAETMISVANANNDPFEQGFAHIWMAYALLPVQQVALSQQHAANSLKFFNELANAFGLSVVHGIILGGIAMQSGDFAAAQDHFQRGLEAATQHDYRRVMQIAYDSLGNLAMFQQLLDAAESYFLKSLAITSESGQTREMLGTLRDLAKLRQFQGKLASAVELLAVVLHHPANTQNSLFRQEQLRDEAEKMRVELEEALAPEQYAAAWQRGTSLVLENVAQGLLQE